MTPPKQLEGPTPRLTVQSMKPFLVVFLLAASLVGQTEAPTTSASGIPIDQANMQKARVLINQAIEALGGQAYLNIQDMSQEGRGYSFHHGDSTSAGIQFWRFVKFPDKDRVEVTKQRDVMYVYNANTGYEVTYKGARAMEPKDLANYLRRRHYALDQVLRTWINDPKTALFYEGNANAADKPAEQVTVLNPQNEGVTLLLRYQHASAAQEGVLMAGSHRQRTQQRGGNLRQLSSGARGNDAVSHHRLLQR